MRGRSTLISLVSTDGVSDRDDLAGGLLLLTSETTDVYVLPPNSAVSVSDGLFDRCLGSVSDLCKLI